MTAAGNGETVELILDVAALASWMKKNVTGFEGNLKARRFEGGQSNPTYRVDTPGRSYVLRRKPQGKLLHGAHAVDREARVTSALWKAGFPVPQVHAVCADESVLGSSFFVMEMVEGRIFWDSSLPDVPRADRARYFDAMNQTLAELHKIEPAAVGLADYGRTGGYIARQLDRWGAQYQADPAAGRYGPMDQLMEWLLGNVPADDETTIIHGDFRLDNMIFDPHEPRVIAVLDWELSALGHPLADFAYHAMMFRMPPDILGGVGGMNYADAGLPDERSYLTAYCRRTGRTSIPDFDFYVAFNMFRFAAILHGIRGRVINGTAAARNAQVMASKFERVADLGLQQARQAQNSVYRS